MDEDRMLEEIANEYDFRLFRQYEEKQVAHILKKDISTLKRWRKKGMIKYVPMGEREVAYHGMEIAKAILKGIRRDV
ncbi:hypothetical protein [Rhizobium sp. Nf11,1]|uniref:hypothetical protein n=1 Tax=Rhizobium sp. Nf11,1 TaxID=3404923 RepID=UPI003D354EF1